MGVAFLEGLFINGVSARIVFFLYVKIIVNWMINVEAMLPLPGRPVKLPPLRLAHQDVLNITWETLES